MGSLATELGLVGEVDPHSSGGFCRVGIRTRASTWCRRRDRRGGRRSGGVSAPLSRAAWTRWSTCCGRRRRLGVSGQYVRRLLAEGAAFEARRGAAEAAGGAPPPEPSAFLVGTRHPSRGWLVARRELERFSAGRRVVKDRPGFDLTLRPPKSVSVLWALADDERRCVDS
ncbi:MAG: relaxase domain-containing protein [Acidimicrobiales bacterium]